MLKLISLLLVAFLAIKNVELNVVQPQMAAPVVQMVAPVVQAPVNTGEPSQFMGSFGSVETLVDNLKNDGIKRRKKAYYPVDLIAKSKGCIPLATLNSLGTCNKWLEPTNKMSHQACWKQCLKSGSSYAAIAKGNECLCTDATIPLDATFSTSNIPCTGNNFQMCGSTECAEYFILKMSQDTLRQSLRNLEADNIWVHKSDFTTWKRFKNEEYDFTLREIIPTSNSIINIFDCDSQATRPDNCQNFYAVLNGFEDFLATCPTRGVASVTPIDVEWDIVFALQKIRPADPDILLFRKSLCQWVLKVDEVIKADLLYLNFEFDTKTLVLVDKNNQDRTFKINSNSYTLYEKGVQVNNETLPGTWFNKVHHFRNYFRGTYTCSNQLTNPWYTAPATPASI